MATTIIPREQVAEGLAVTTGRLIAYEARGLVRVVREGAVEGYPPAEIRRLWTIVSLQRDLGVNLAGVEAVLRLRAHLEEVHGRLAAVARELEAAVEEAFERDGPD